MKNEDATSGHRRAILAGLGATASECEELLAYSQPPSAQLDLNQEFPLDEEPHVVAWRRYAEGASRDGAVESLRARFCQLRFPIREGISATESYRTATRRGVEVTDDVDGGLDFVRSDGVTLEIHESAAGPMPIITAEARDDFKTLVRAFAHRNEPKEIPDSQGACMVKGFNNWDRIRELRRRFESEPQTITWSQRFQQIAKDPSLYRDSFIILSQGPYSGVPASEMGFSDSEWLAKSQIIRMEHECTHYLTLRCFGAARNQLLDELLADFVGIATAAGAYRADWFLQFMGLTPDGAQSGGRLSIYRGDLSDGAYLVLQVMAKNAAQRLETFDASLEDRTSNGRARLVQKLYAEPLEDLAAPL